MGEIDPLYQVARSIVLVEDSLVEAELLRRTLDRGGYRVTVAYDGREALAAIRARPPDLVMSDIRMPVMDGYALCRAIKQDPVLAHIPVILLSVLSEPDDIIEAINAGADSYTTKPYTEASLLDRLNSLLAERNRAQHRPGEPLEVEYRDQVHRISADPQQMLNLLISVYENTLVQNRELISIQAQLCQLNESLEAKVQERTAALQQSEARFRATFEQAAVGIALMSPDSRWLKVNQRLCEIIGYSQDEIRSLSCTQITYPDDLEITRANMEKLLSGQSGSHRYEKRYVRKNGESVWVHQTLSLVPTVSGSPDYFISVIEDISERKAAQDAVLRLNAELEQRVEERTAELQVTNSELENFVSAVSHDLRAPLRALKGFSAILQQNYRESLEDDARSCLDQIQQSALRMGDLIDGLLTLSRNTRGEMRHEKVDLSALAERNIADLARAHPDRQVQVDIQPGLLAVGDARMFDVLLGNLLGNAWKYTLRTDNPRIRFYSEAGESRTRYSIADNGVGFDMAYVGRLFQPFQRLHRQDEFPGIGIGLATVKRIVERHGGYMQVSARPGEGAVFSFCLPAAKEGAGSGS